MKLFALRALTVVTRRAVAFQVEHYDMPWHVVTTHTLFVIWRGNVIRLSSSSHPHSKDFLRSTARRWDRDGEEYVKSMHPGKLKTSTGIKETL